MGSILETMSKEESAMLTMVASGLHSAQAMVLAIELVYD